MAITRFTRQEFLDLIWSKPMRSVAADLGLSDVAVRKATIRAEFATTTTTAYLAAKIANKIPYESIRRGQPDVVGRQVFRGIRQSIPDNR